MNTAILNEKIPRTVLVIDDSPEILLIINELLKRDYRIKAANSGEKGLRLAREEPRPDIILLDIMMPRLDGFAVCAELRRLAIPIPILMLTAKGQIEDRVVGLDAGADDYLPKPFELAELVARVRALTRRGGETKPTLLRVVDLSLDTLTHKAERGGATIELTAREYRLLEFLMRSAGRLCGRMMILEKVWDYNFDPGTNLVDVYIRRLREKIDANFEPKLLQTVRGSGYILKELP